MCTTPQWIFDRAIALMDELNESNGLSDYADTKEYKQRTLPILNVLRHECYRFSDRFNVPEAEAGRRPICPEMTSMDEEIQGIDDAIAQGVMPYGLAAQLLLYEDSEAASFFNQKYQELLYSGLYQAPATAQPIENLYGNIEFGEFARW